MKPFKFISLFALAGFIIPIYAITILAIAEKWYAGEWIDFANRFLAMHVLLWPSSAGMMKVYEPSILGNTNILFLVKSILSNVVLYGLLGEIVWLGVFKKYYLLLGIVGTLFALGFVMLFKVIPWEVMLASVFLNGMVFGILGAMIWLGIRKYRYLLYVPIVILILCWIGLFTAP